MGENFKTVQTNSGPMRVFVLPSEGIHPPSPQTAIIVLQEAFGVNSHIQNVCRRFAKEGYAVFSPELFHRAGDGIVIPYNEFPKVRPILGKLTNEMLLEDFKATFELARASDAKQVFAVGFCMGGFVSALAACHLPLQGAVSFYGGGMTHERPGIGFSPILQEFKNLKCPVLMHFGGEDKGIPKEDVRKIREALMEAQADYEICYFPQADHGFFCDERPTYNEEAAKKSWTETLRWLKQKLSAQSTQRRAER